MSLIEDAAFFSGDSWTEENHFLPERGEQPAAACSRAEAAGSYPEVGKWEAAADGR